MAEYALGLGANVGDRAGYLARGLGALAALPGTKISAMSPVYETPPWGVTDQGAFLNLCILAESPLDAQALLGACKRIEADIGRQHRARWGPREIDIDLLWSSDEALDGETLTLPHKQIAARRFVLKPLSDIAPELVIRGREVAEWLDALGPETDEDRLSECPDLKAPLRAAAGLY